MNIISRVNPVNIAEERAKFWQDHTYNPQFEYANTFKSEDLYIWGKPKTLYYEHALQMMEKYPLVRQEDQPEYVTEAEILAAVDQFNQRYDLDEKITVEFSPTLVSKCKVVGMSLLFLTPITYTRTKFEDLLRHELETHLLRKINHRRQGWQLPLTPEQDLRRTEEGLAGLHTHLFRQNKMFTRSFLTYIAAYTAQQGSFVDVFNQLKSFNVSNQSAWRIAVRTKRGLRDTTQPGGLTKDITYFEGAVLVWQWLQNPAHSPQDLYLGRLSVDQIAEYKNQALAKPYIPSFMEDVATYHQHLSEIGEINEFNKLVSEDDVYVAN